MNTRSFSISVSTSHHTLVQVKDFQFPENRIVFLFGESGIGKSIVSKVVAGQLDPEGLDVTVNGETYADYLKKPVVRSGKERGFFVFQEPSSHLDPTLTLRTQLNEGSLKACPNDEDVLKQLFQSASQADLGNILDIYPKPFRPSGGEKQRLLLSMAMKKIRLYQSTPEWKEALFVFDEPTGSLDNIQRNRFLSLLFAAFRKKPFTLLFITHDYSLISEINANYSDLLKSVSFLEMARIHDTDSVISTFVPSDYTTWLDKLVPNTAENKAQTPLFRMEPSFKIFGRSLTLVGPDKTNPIPLVIHPGEMVYVKAGSGVGKTTLAKIILGLYAADQVSITLDGLTITEKKGRLFYEKEVWGKRAGMVFQHADEALDLKSTVFETFLGLIPGKIPPREEIKEYLAALFDSPIPDAFLNKKVQYLSGGQKQRLNLLRSFYGKPKLLILDEPLNGLDFESIRKVLDLLSKKQKEGCGLLLISHNEEIFDKAISADHLYYLK
ncbi:MAG: hypothetical protein A2293_01740 [Elusimicrobia bacterium RIFOXYB2_FULL_49_7]|nr:MAG: hypothetical protein A2293_01740 [Elusimicrobia bacterium RIFOXYB2_FULL_49_7]